MWSPQARRKRRASPRMTTNPVQQPTTLGRQWFLWAFDMAMARAVDQHGDAARLAAYEARIEFERRLPANLTATTHQEIA